MSFGVHNANGKIVFVACYKTDSKICMIIRKRRPTRLGYSIHVLSSSCARWKDVILAVNHPSVCVLLIFEQKPVKMALKLFTIDRTKWKQLN